MVRGSPGPPGLRVRPGVREAVRMSTPIPQPLRAAAGLAAVAIDSARKLPAQLVGLPVLAVSTALQASLKAQQQYAELVARGDQLLGHLRPAGDGAPPWARFDDEPVAAGAPADGTQPASAFDAVADPLDELLDEEAADLLGEPASGTPADDAESDLDLSRGAPAAGATGTDRELADLASELVPDLAGPDGAGPAADVASELVPDLAGPEPGPAGPGPAEGEPGADADAELADREGIEWELAEHGAGEAADGVPDGVPGADPTAYGGDLAAEPPLPGYDELTVPQLRGRLRALDEPTIERLVAYERAHGGRPPYLTMLENRLTTLRSSSD